MSNAELLIAFAGSGTVTPANVKALIDDQLIGERDVAEFYVPDKIAEKKQPGLANVVGYLTKYWGDDDSSEDPFKTAPVSNLDAVLRTGARDGLDPVLVILAGDDGADDETADLVEAALQSDIRVLDLAAGLDEVTATEDEAEEVPAEPEPEPEAPKRRRRTTAAPEAEKPAPARTRGKPRSKAEVAEVGEKALDDLKAKRAAADDTPPFDGPYKGEGINLSKFSKSVDKIDFSKLSKSVEGVSVSSGESVRDLLIVALRGALSALEAADAPLGAVLDAADAGQPGPTTAYIRDDETGKLRKRGRGKPRAGETAVYLTPSQEKAARAKGELE